LNKVVIKILQSSVVSQAVLGGLTTYPPGVYYSAYVPKIITMG